MIFDTRACELGEGPLWHPARQELFWFDILNRSLHSQAQSWTFDFMASAAGWVDENTLILASDHALYRFDIPTGDLTALCDLEAENEVTRSNDGRADPWGGFWIGTMARAAEPNAGAIYRFFKGELRQIVPNISISNAICFTPDSRFAQYTDTPTQKIMRVALDPDTGWPAGDPEVWLDLSDAGLFPDGAVVGADGTFWLACWGAGAVLGFDIEGREIARHEVAASQTTCPAFGGPELRDLYITSALEGLATPSPDCGKTFVLKNVAQGLREPQVIL